MSEQQVIVQWKDLQDFVEKVFIKVGMPVEDAQIEAEVLVWANLRGVDSHGVLKIHWYIDNFEKGLMNPRPNIKTVWESSATLLIEADRALGPVVTVPAMQKVMAKAKDVGIGWCQIRNVTHQGAIGYYSQLAANNDMAGVVIACHPPNTAPFGACAPGVHNSPIAISVPCKSCAHINLDMATSIAAGGKIDLAIDKDSPIPLGWALDKDGNPTTDPKLVGALIPIAGPKGSGLALLFECLTGLMVGNPLLEPVLEGRRPASHHIQNSIVAAIDIAHFTDVEHFKVHADRLIAGIKSLPKAEGFEEILVPGEMEERICAQRLNNGIPLPEGTINNLKEICDKYSLNLPKSLQGYLPRS
jgi:LDH2 family malate/lactate/ureidoglycolate dehydrogenase